MGRIVKFAVATAMRQDEIFRVVWDDLNTRTKRLTILNRKDPRQKKGNDQRIPLLAVSGYDALAHRIGSAVVILTGPSDMVELISCTVGRVSRRANASSR